MFTLYTYTGQDIATTNVFRHVHIRSSPFEFDSYESYSYFSFNSSTTAVLKRQALSFKERKSCLSHSGDGHCIADVIRPGFVRPAAAQSRGQLSHWATMHKMAFHCSDVIILLPVAWLHFWYLTSLEALHQHLVREAPEYQRFERKKAWWRA